MHSMTNGGNREGQSDPRPRSTSWICASCSTIPGLERPVPRGCRSRLNAGSRRKAASTGLARTTPFDTLASIDLDILGRALKDAGDPAGAETVRRRAQLRYPGGVWINAGHWAEAIATAEQSLARAKDLDASNGFCLALALWQQGVKDRSRSCFDQAASRTEKNDPKYANLLALWREAAAILGQPGPSAGAPLPDLPAEPFAP